MENINFNEQVWIAILSLSLTVGISQNSRHDSGVYREISNIRE